MNSNTLWELMRDFNLPHFLSVRSMQPPGIIPPRNGCIRRNWNHRTDSMVLQKRYPGQSDRGPKDPKKSLDQTKSVRFEEDPGDQLSAEAYGIRSRRHRIEGIPARWGSWTPMDLPRFISIDLFQEKVFGITPASALYFI